MYTTTQTAIQRLITDARRTALDTSHPETDAAVLQVIARNLANNRAALHAYALHVYTSGRYLSHPAHNTWAKWLKYALGQRCTYKDISLVKYSALVLARLDDSDIQVGGKRLTSIFFLTKRLSYLHDALKTLRKLGTTPQDIRLFEQVIIACASLSRADLRANLDALNFRRDDRPVCQVNHLDTGAVTYQIICTSAEQAAKLKARLAPLVILQSSAAE